MLVAYIAAVLAGAAVLLLPFVSVGSHEKVGSSRVLTMDGWREQ